jgi:hypothetical protein
LYECWDAENRRPTKEYQQVIRKFKKDMGDLGVRLRPELRPGA